jgi:mycothiol synthase
MSYSTRPFEGPDDFVTMGRILSESWRLARPLVSHTVADLEWWTVNDPDMALIGQARIWLWDDEPVGWEWLDPPATGDWHLRPGLDPAPYLEPMLDRIEATARAARESDPAVAATTAWSMDADPAAIAVLAGRGYVADGLALSHWVRTLPIAGGPPVLDPPLPPRYRHASVRWPEDLPERVEVHRAAFAPSKMTLEKYNLLSALPHYAPERDRVVVAPDGTFAAFANGWFDPDGLVGELEPVGTHPDHRRKGLARAACLAAIRELERAGAREVVINTGRSNLAAEALYERLGCVRVTTSRRYARPLGV